MSILDNFAHGILVVLAAFARFTLAALAMVEGWFRALMKDAGVGIDVQTVLMIFILIMFLVGVMRLLGGRLRMTLAFVLILILAHTLAAIGSAPLGGG